MSDASVQYAALTDAAGLVDFSGRTRIEVSGTDRLEFLQGFCTNDVGSLTPGHGCEAFITNVQGKTLGHVLVFVESEAIVLDTVAGQADVLLPHLDRYIIREDVQLNDQTEQYGELLLAGKGAEALLAGLVSKTLPADLLAHGRYRLADCDVSLRRVDLTGPSGYLIACASSDVSKIQNALCAAGAVMCDREAFEQARVEAGTPMYGADITSENLPQEVGRNERAVSFTKGCYLGQETVARIDALGHVNKVLVGLKFGGGEIPTPGTELIADDRPVGKVTWAVLSPRLDAPLALAYVRTKYVEPGSKLDSSFGAAVVVSLPLV